MRLVNNVSRKYVPSTLLLNKFNKVVQWKIKDREYMVAVMHKKILIWFAQVLLKIIKYLLADIHNLLKPEYGTFYESK